MKHDDELMKVISEYVEGRLNQIERKNKSLIIDLTRRIKDLEKVLRTQIDNDIMLNKNVDKMLEIYNNSSEYIIETREILDALISGRQVDISRNKKGEIEVDLDPEDEQKLWSMEDILNELEDPEK